MSIYSGFATRHQEETYDRHLQAVVFIMQKRLLKFYKGEPADEQKFTEALSRLFGQLRHMESHKYLEPKNSYDFEDLVNFLKNKQMHEASVFGNKMSEAAQIGQEQGRVVAANCYKPATAPLNQTKAQLNMPKQFQLFNASKDKQKVRVDRRQTRPSTTHNKIRKRANTKSYYSSGQTQHLSEARHSQAQISHNLNGQISDNHEAPQIQNIINPSKTRLIGISRNEPRHASSQSVKQKPSLKGRQRKFEENSEQHQEHNGEGEPDVRQLIQAYISKTKRNYIKGINRRREELEELLRFV